MTLYLILSYKTKKELYTVIPYAVLYSLNYVV